MLFSVGFLYSIRDVTFRFEFYALVHIESPMSMYYDRVNTLELHTRLLWLPVCAANVLLFNRLENTLFHKF